MLLELIAIVSGLLSLLLLPIMIYGIRHKMFDAPPAKPRRRKFRQVDPYGKPHGLPWHDLDYQKWLRRQEEKDSNRFKI